LLANPDSYVAPEMEDQVYIVTNSIVNAIRDNPTPERWTQGMSVLCRIVDQNGDIAAGAFPELMDMRRKNPDLKKAELPRDDIVKYSDILTRAKVLKRKSDSSGNS
jgi:hypothetical protein